MYSVTFHHCSQVHVATFKMTSSTSAVESNWVHLLKCCTWANFLGFCTLLEYFQFPILLLLLHYISEANIVLLLHYNYLKTWVTSYFSDISYHIIKHPLATWALYFITRLFENSRSTSSQRVALQRVVSL